MSNKNLIKKASLFLFTILFLTTSGCAKTSNSNTKNQNNTNSTSNSSTTLVKEYKSQYTGKKPIVTIEMEDGSKVKAELYPDIAPKTVDNFIKLIQNGFYDGLTFHRVIPGFMIQGGDPNGNGTGGADEKIPGEFTANGFQNDLKHTRGVLSMARAEAPNSASSQFFIMVQDFPDLDGKYASFGKVLEGMDTADKIVSVERDRNDKPLTPQKMKKVTVEIK
jgi:peptidyl-prolyl cis-trans isomerase B (cyclophilin B)